MKSARLSVIALVLLAAAVTLVPCAGAQSIPEVPISTGPHAVAPAIEPIPAWGSEARAGLVPALAGNPLAPLMPVWLPTLQWPSSPAWPAATREASVRVPARERNRIGRIGSR